MPSSTEPWVTARVPDDEGYKAPAMSAQYRSQQQACLWVMVMFLEEILSVHYPPTLSSN